jgi:peptidylamidoglycolate lyase
MTDHPSFLPSSRRSFLRDSLSAGLALSAFPALCQSPAPILGQGDFRYRLVPGWGELDPSTPVQNCHGLAMDREGHLILLTDHTANNVIIYDRAGKLVSKWGSEFPGAHGLSLVSEGTREVLFITDLKTHRVVKTTLSGEKLEEWRWPEETGKYSQESDYRPSWTLHLPSGDFFVLDGYGRDYIAHYSPNGKLQRLFGGAEGGIPHWGPHGGICDPTPDGSPSLLIAMSDQQHLLRLSPEGSPLAQTPLPGGNPRQIRHVQNHYFVAHLADNWPKDRNSRGFVSVLDAQMRVVSNVGGTAPQYTDDGRLRPMASAESPFLHPHDLCVDSEGSLYVAQFASNRTYPLKLERV